jgi:hypothetical protein
VAAAFSAACKVEAVAAVQVEAAAAAASAAACRGRRRVEAATGVEETLDVLEIQFFFPRVTHSWACWA